jgi:hypothetical protein
LLTQNTDSQIIAKIITKTIYLIKAMNFIDSLLIIQRMDQLIRMKATGSPREFSERLEISESTLYKWLEILRYLKCPIVYDTHRRSYVYTREGQFKIKFEHTCPK